jgi:hypothetical protein
MRRWLMGVGVAGVLAGVACSSGSSPPGAGGGGGSAGQGGGGGGTTGAGGQGGASCPPSQATDLPGGINLNDECPYAGANTADCGAGTFAYDCPDPLGFGVPPEGGCIHPTSGTNMTLRWCCTTALCSHFPTRDGRCDCQAANRYDYNCAPGATAAATCAATAGGDFCCAFN